jgi:hypothetical protein
MAVVAVLVSSPPTSSSPQSGFQRVGRCSLPICQAGVLFRLEDRIPLAVETATPVALWLYLLLYL